MLVSKWDNYTIQWRHNEASQITGVSIVAQPFVQAQIKDQRKHQSTCYVDLLEGGGGGGVIFGKNSLATGIFFLPKGGGGVILVKIL